MISGFNHEIAGVGNGKPAILPYGNGSVVFNNVNGEFENPFFEIVDGEVVKRKLPSDYLSGVGLPMVELSTHITEAASEEAPIALTEAESIALQEAADGGMPVVVKAVRLLGMPYATIVTQNISGSILTCRVPFTSNFPGFDIILRGRGVSSWVAIITNIRYN